MKHLKRILVHLSVLVGIASIVLEQDHLLSSFSPNKDHISEDSSSDVLLTKAIQDNLQKRAEKTPVVEAPNSIAFPLEVGTFAELRSIKWKGPRAKLVQSFNDDVLDGQKVFDQLSTYSKLYEALRPEIAGYERGTLRSGTYKESSGFDQIYYKIYYASGSIGHIFMRERDGVELMIYGISDKGYYAQSFKNGVWSSDQELSLDGVKQVLSAQLNGSSQVLSNTIGSIF